MVLYVVGFSFFLQGAIAKDFLARGNHSNPKLRAKLGDCEPITDPGSSCVDDCNWCCSGWSAQSTATFPNGSHLKPDYTGTYCGKYQEGEDWITDLSCTPFNFKPMLMAQPSSCNWGGGYPVAWDSEDESPEQTGMTQNRVWRADDFGFWVFHGCDGAGIQSADCNGDIYYAEYIYDTVDEGDSSPQPVCDMGTDACDDPDVNNPGEWSPECRHNKCTHFHSGLDQWHSYKCGWWNGGTFAESGDTEWYRVAQWDEIYQNWVESFDTENFKYGWLQLFDWVCFTQGIESDEKNPCKDEDDNTIPCGQTPDFEDVQYYTEFPQGNIQEIFTGREDMRCICDNEPYGYAEGEKRAPPGGRLFAIWWENPEKEGADGDKMWIQQLAGPEIDDRTGYWYDGGVFLRPSSP